jgi:murein DD-endopeptidase MepM/ murein hydrolase activator NlpD
VLAAVISIAIACCSLLLSTIPTAGLPSQDSGTGPVYPAPPGYLLPWEGGRIHTVTQGEETSFTHNGRAAYAFDFNLNYDTVVAARSGRVTHAYLGSNSGGCGAEYAGAANYIVIDHGDGTSAQYLHLAHGSAEVALGDLVRQGEPIALSGETGITCTGVDEDINPAPHLHFQVQRNDSASYMRQSLPVTFDDVPGDGVPQEGASLVSGNYGPGEPQKIKLTARRVPRPFNPRAVPADPNMFEVKDETPTPDPTPTPGPEVLEPAGTSVTPGASETPIPTETPLPEDTETPEPTNTPPPAATPEPGQTGEPTPEPSLPPGPSPEPTVEDEGTPEPPPDEPTPSVYVPLQGSTAFGARREIAA